MRSPAETSETRDKLDALAKEASARIGPVASASVCLDWRDPGGRSDERGAVAVYIRFETIRLDACTRRTPPPLFAYGHCDLSAIEAAHREIARRVLEETESA